MQQEYSKTLEIKLEHHSDHYYHLVLINRSSRKKIQVQELHDLSNLPVLSSSSRIPFPPVLFFVLFVISKKILAG